MSVQPPAASNPPPNTPDQPATEAPRRRRGLVLGIVLGGIALVAAIAVVATFLIVRRGSEQSDVVMAYLQAVAAADAETAIGYLADPPEDRAMLTDEVLQQSNELGGIGEPEFVEVVLDSEVPGKAWVDVMLSADEERVTVTYTVEERDGAFKIIDGLSENSTSQAQLQTMPMTVNGVQPEGESMYLFPGVYQLANDNPYLEWDQDTWVLLAGSFETTTFNPHLGISEAGEQAVSEAVTATFTKCLQSTDLEPDGCPFAETTGREVENVSWESLTEPTWSGSFSDADLTVGGLLEGRVRVSYVDVDSGESVQQDKNVYAPTTVDLTTEPPTVTFRL